MASVARSWPRSEDDLVQESLQLLTLDLEAAHGVTEVPDPLLVPEPLFAQPLVGALQLHHAHLQLLVHLKSAVVHVAEGCRLLGQVLKLTKDKETCFGFFVSFNECLIEPVFPELD